MIFYSILTLVNNLKTHSQLFSALNGVCLLMSSVMLLLFSVSWPHSTVSLIFASCLWTFMPTQTILKSSVSYLLNMVTDSYLAGWLTTMIPFFFLSFWLQSLYVISKPIILRLDSATVTHNESSHFAYQVLWLIWRYPPKVSCVDLLIGD